MRVPVVLAGLTVVADTGYRWSKSKPPTARALISWAVVFITLGALGLSQFATLADIFAYMIIAIILLNDGYDLVGQL